MKTASILTLLALSTALTSPALAAPGAITPIGQDDVLCRGMIDAMDRHERSLQFAQADTQSKPPQAQPQKTEAELATELSDLLQACSYDGVAFKVDPKALSEAGGGEEAVQAIMRFTGLPQNFKVMEGNVPNAAALIVMNASGIPERIIAYNSGFMTQVRSATENNDWASISIMAHEIGHHLSGHTLMPGGSQPPIELEADKFSGFVLFKMGAKLADAQKAIATLVPEEDGPTHPGRPKRLAAIDSGWTESCEQQQTECGAEAVIAKAEAPAPAPAIKQPPVVAAPEPPTASPPTEPEVAATPPAAEKPASGSALDAGALAQLPATELEALLIEKMSGLTSPGADIDAVTRDIELVNAALAARHSGETPEPAAKMPDIPGPADITMPGEKGQSLLASKDKLPKLDASATPSKFDRFVYDEVGTFDTATKDKLAKLAFDYAAANNIEIVTIVTDDLQGRTADQFALDAMRQLRVGKLDVGNGAVLVVAPKARQTGVALGAGLLVEYEDTTALRGYLESYLKLLDGGTRPDAAAELIADASYRIMRDTKSWEWVIRYPSLAALLTRAEEARKELEASGAKYDPKTDPTWKKLLRIHATVVTASPDKADKTLDVNDIHEDRVGPAIHVRTAEGQNALLYVNPSVRALMPVALEEGKTYAFIARDSFAAADTPQFDLISYDLIN